MQDLYNYCWWTYRLTTSFHPSSFFWPFFGLAITGVVFTWRPWTEGDTFSPFCLLTCNTWSLLSLKRHFICWKKLPIIIHLNFFYSLYSFASLGCTYGLVFSTVFLIFSTSLSLIFKFSGSVPKSSRSPIPEAWNKILFHNHLQCIRLSPTHL